MWDGQGGNGSNKKRKVTIGGIAAPDLRSLYFFCMHCFPRERGGVAYQGRISFFFSSLVDMAAGALNFVDT